MVLLLYKDLANLFRHSEFTKRFALPDAIAVITNGVVFIFEIEPQYLFRIFRRAYLLGSNPWHFAEIVDLPRDDQGMIELLLGVEFELRGDAHVLGAAEHLRIDYVGDDGLIFAGKVFVQQLREAVAGNFVFVCGGFGLGHWIAPLHAKTDREYRAPRIIPTAVHRRPGIGKGSRFQQGAEGGSGKTRQSGRAAGLAPRPRSARPGHGRPASRIAAPNWLLYR